MTKAAVLFTGAVALALVARAALIYRAGDPVAFGLVLLIGFGLTLGMLELLVRSARAERLTREVLGLPSPATEAAIAESSPPLAAVLRARIAGSNGLVIAAPFTPYLLGLLVMIGLLGTFLGLFETLRGAREALTASGDVAALRSGLAAPMAGLSRAFGTSAAGVSASAMLGLGGVFVRRAEARFVNALNRYATGPLAPLLLASRTLAALETIAARSEALPDAARALREATRGLSELEASMQRAQEQSAARAAAEIRGAAAAIRETASEVRVDLGAAIERTRTAVQTATEELLARAVASATAVAREELGKVTAGFAAQALADAARDGLLEELIARLDETAAGLGATASTQAAQLQAFTEAAAARAREGEARLEARHLALAAHTERTLDAQAERFGSFAAALQREREGFAAQLSAFAEAEGARAVEREARAELRGVALTGRAEAVLDAQAERFGSFAESLQRERAAFAAELSTFTARLERDREAGIAELGAFTARLERDREAGIAELGAFTQRLERDREAGVAELGAFTQRLERDREAGVAELGAFTQRLERDREAGAAELGAFTQRLERDREAGAAELGAFTQRLERDREAGAAALAERLGDHARGLGEELAATTRVVHDAADLLRAGGAEMAAVAEMFTLAVDRYREASDRWLKNLGAIEDAIARREGGEAVDVLTAYLDQTREVFDHALQFQRELFLELRALRSGPRG